MKNLLKNLLVIFCSLLAIEVLVRLFLASGLSPYSFSVPENSSHKYSEIKELIYELKPNLDIHTNGMLLKTNSHGLRDREYSLEKPRDTFRIVVLGDSTSFGFKIEDYKNIYTELLEKDLNDVHEKNIEVINFSVSGYNSFQEKITLSHKALKFSPDFVLLAVCLNDYSYTDGLGALTKQGAPWSIASKINSKALLFLLHLYEEFRYKKFYDDTQVKSLLSDLNNLKDKGINSLIVIMPNLKERMSRRKSRFYRAVLKEIEDKNLDSLDLITLWKKLSPQEKSKLFLPDDNVHFSELGMIRAKDEILKKIYLGEWDK